MIHTTQRAILKKAGYLLMASLVMSINSHANEPVGQLFVQGGASNIHNNAASSQNKQSINPETANPETTNQETDKKIIEKVTQVIVPLMQQYDVPGMAVGIVQHEKTYQTYYGSKTHQDHTAKSAITNPKNFNPAIDDQTIFELGSVSKLFTATAGAYAKVQGKLSFDDSVAKYCPEFKNKPIGQLKLINLATYTSGNLPLQFPDTVKTNQQIKSYFDKWTVNAPVGEYRQYSNPSIGLFGQITARAMHTTFSRLMEKQIFPALHLNHTYIDVPATQQINYAYGHDASNAPIRVNPGALAEPAYGVKSTLPDMLQFLKANLAPQHYKKTMQTAILQTHHGYYQLGQMTQALGWEKFSYPASLATLQASNSEKIVLEPNWVHPAKPSTTPAIYHKTGSTNGFGAYIVFVPSQQLGVVMLMNKKIPNQERIKAAYDIMNALITEK